MWGNGGDDLITAGKAGDWLGGGDGADTFIFESASIVNTPGENGTHCYVDEFSHEAGDKIDFSGIAGLSFIGTAAFSNFAGQLRYEFQDGNTFLHAELDGNGQADMTLELGGEIDFVSDDFILI